LADCSLGILYLGFDLAVCLGALAQGGDGGGGGVRAGVGDGGLVFNLDYLRSAGTIPQDEQGDQENCRYGDGQDDAARGHL
jgi:hypothetical protein